MRSDTCGIHIDLEAEPNHFTGNHHLTAFNCEIFTLLLVVRRWRHNVTTRDRLFGISLILALLAASGCNRETTKAAGFQMPAPLVTVAPAIARDVPVYLE